MIATIKRLASYLPVPLQQKLKRRHFSHQIRNGTFKSDECEFARLEEWVSAGDWVLDVGANVGQYTARLSGIVGPTGRVFAFEPVPRTFEILSANSVQFAIQNVTLINAAASDTMTTSSIRIPKFDTGLDNYYMANLTAESTNLSIMCLPIDTLSIPRRISLAKIDVEGHELPTLKGMEKLIRRDKPVLIVEGYINEVAVYLSKLGYTYETDKGSSNRVYSYAE